MCQDQDDCEEEYLEPTTKPPHLAPPRPVPGKATVPGPAMLKGPLQGHSVFCQFRSKYQ